MCAVASLSLLACSEDDEPTITTCVVGFEGNYWQAYAADEYDKTYSSEVVTSNYIWQDYATTLTSHPVTTEWDGVEYLSSGFAVSAYCSNDLEPFTAFGGYLKDLFVYNPKYKYSILGGGNGGSNRFLVGYGNYEEGNDDFRPTLTFADGKARTINSCYVNSTAYFVAITETGNEFSPALQAGDKITLTATGYDAAGAETGSTTMVLAEKGNITKSWTEWNLESLGEVVKVRFNITGGPTDEWGMKSPKYFAIDDITISWPEE